MIHFDWNNFLTNSSELEFNQINDTKAKLEELKKEFAEIFKENPQSKVKGKLAHFVFQRTLYQNFFLLEPFFLLEKMVKQGYWTSVSQNGLRHLYQCLKRTEVCEFVAITSLQLIRK